tara:strand:+ start:232215 stop:233999 length:1785 start_codon:yes stop_codon:yes gene_type:complete
MRIKIIAILFFTTTFCFSQSPELAYNYFRKGEYEKATVLYQQLYEKNKVRRDYFKKLLSCYQLTENFEEATNLLQQHIKTFPNQVNLNIEIGYNFQLQDQQETATPYYEKALHLIDENPNYGYLIGRTFQDNHLLDYALKAYKRAMELNPELNYDAYVALIYGEKAELEKMFDSYLNMVSKNENYFSTVQRYAGRFITDDSLDSNNIIFRKLLLKRLQANPNNAWNMLLSWLYMQQKDYDKALIQEKALYNRNHESLDRIVELGSVAFNDTDYETTKNTFQFVLENTSNPGLEVEAQLYLLQTGVATAISNKEIETVNEKFKLLLTNYGVNSNTIDLQIAYADFLTFKKDEPQEAILILEEALKRTTSQFQNGSVKVKLADILVYTNKFNQALINYTQVQTSLKNSILAQTARFKVAQTSYFKGDYKWALTQLKVLKSSTSQLIANDALELHLLISDNIADDSIPKALQLYAKADVLAFQNKNKEAIDSLSAVLATYKGHPIEDEALFKQAALYEKTKKYNFAEENYQKIIALEATGILVDNAYYKLGMLYEQQLDDVEKAKEMYQKIIFEFPSSIYLVDARKRFRKLRGDTIN